MAYPGVLLRYFIWHYTAAPADIFLVWRNLFWFVGHYFSMPLLLKTFFSPWKRMTEQYQKNGLEALAEVIVMNLMSRFLGMVVRLGLLLVGLFIEIFLIVGLFVFFALWVIWPAVAAVAVVAGVAFLIP